MLVKQVLAAMRAVSCLGMAAFAVTTVPTIPAYAAEPGVSADKIAIGMFGVVSGPMSFFSVINEGALAVYKEVNDAGGSSGSKIDLRLYDDARDGTRSRAAVKELIFRDDVFLIHGGSCSAPVFAAREEFIDTEVPLMVLAATMDKITQPTAPTIFTTAFPASFDGEAAANFAKSIPNARRLAIIRHADEWGDTKVERMAPILAGSNLTVVADIRMDRGASDATAQVLALKEAHPDVVIFAMFTGESAIFLRDAHKYGLQAKFIGMTSAMDIEDLAQRAGGPDAVNDVYVVSFLKGPIGDPTMDRYTELFHKYYPNERLQSMDLWGMSGAYAIVDALRLAGPDLTRAKFVAALQTIKDGDAGPALCRLTFSATEHRGCLDYTMWTLRGGKVAAIGPVWVNQ